MSRSRIAFGVIVAALLSAAAAALLLRAPARPNVVLITVDTLRPDRLGCYGNPKNKTPNIDALAAEGVRFERAFCDVTWTTPSMSSVMTGTYATQHGMRSTYQQLDPGNVTVAEVLKQRGYQTAAIIGSFPLDAAFGLNQGFDSYDDHFTAPVVTGGDAPAEHVPSQFSSNVEDQRLFQYLKAQADAYRPDNEVSDAAIDWLRTQRRAPFFLWVHYFGPHELNDMRLTPEQQNDHNIAVYDTDVERTDAQVGRLLNAMDDLQLRDRTLTILHADHGQSLGEHEYVGHGRNLYDPTLRVPLLMRLPGVIPTQLVIGSLVRNIDIMPTALDLAGASIPADVTGQTLRTLWTHASPAEDREVYCETYLPATEAFSEEVPDGHGGIIKVGIRRRGIRTAQWKFVINDQWPLLDYAKPPTVPDDIAQQLHSEELYDLQKNPLELSPGLVTDRPDVSRDLHERIVAYGAEIGHGGAHRELDEAAKERLRSLGYMH